MRFVERAKYANNSGAESPDEVTRHRTNGLLRLLNTKTLPAVCFLGTMLVEEGDPKP